MHWGENALASREFLEKHQITAPKIKMGRLLDPAKASWSADQMSSRGRVRQRRLSSALGEQEWQGNFLFLSGTQAALETQTLEEALKVTQSPNIVPESDSRLSSDASVLERTEQKRERNDPGSLEICVTEHQALCMYSVDLGRGQLNLGCWVSGQLDGSDGARSSRGGYSSHSLAYCLSIDPCKTNALSTCKPYIMCPFWSDRWLSHLT